MKPIRILFLSALALTSSAQQTISRPVDASQKSGEDPYWHNWKQELGEGPIQDNSFLVEEAYNQEYGVAQHINTFTRLWQSKSWAYSFTQEWPVDFAPKNQLSYTVIGMHSGDYPASSGGMGDIALNYRYQLVGNGETNVAVAPRISLLLPSGNSSVGCGAGGGGVQTNWAISVALDKRFTNHFNAGATLIPHTKDADGNSAATYGYNFDHSLIWNLHPRLNALLETAFYRGETVVGQGKTQWGSQLLLNPGVRWAYNFSSGL